MASFVTFKAMLGRHKRGAFMLAIIVLVLVLGLSAYYKQASAPDTKTSIQSNKPAGVSESVSTNNELSDRIKQLVKDLEYPDKVADYFTRMVMEWKCELGRPLLIVWRDRLDIKHRFYKETKISKDQIVKIEEEILREFLLTTRMQFSYKSLAFELSDVIENRQANCLGFSQLMYITGNAVGLSVRPIDVLDPLISSEGGARKGHIACIVDLFDGRLVMADVLLLFEIPNRAFKLEDQFVKVGNYWELKDEDNPLQIHRRIRLLDGNGLLAVIYNNRAGVFRSEGEYDRAILEYNKAIEIDPNYASAYMNRGKTYADKGEFDRAILEYNKAIEIDPRYATAYFNRGIAYANKDEYVRAILDYTKAIEIDPRFTEAYYNRGMIYANKGEYDRAILDYTKAIEINPKFTDAYNNRGNTYFKKDEYDRAILDYEKVIEIDPGDAMAYHNRGIIYSNKDEFDRAILDYDKAIEIDPKFTDAYYSRGTVYSNKGEQDGAILDLTKAIEFNPKYADAYNNRGNSYYGKKEYDRAILDFDKAIEIDPKYTGAYNSRGSAYFEKDEYDRAILDFEKAIEIDPEYALAYLNRGEVYAEIGKSEEAKKDMLKALELDPELKESVKKVTEQYKLDLKLD